MTDCDRCGRPANHGVPSGVGYIYLCDDCFMNPLDNPGEKKIFETGVNKGYIDGIAEGERALSNYSIIDFIIWRCRMRNNLLVKEKNCKIRIGQLEQHIKRHQEELEELKKT